MDGICLHLSESTKQILALQPAVWGNLQPGPPSLCNDSSLHLSFSDNSKATAVSQTSKNRMRTTWDVYCCLLPQCEALHTCRLGFPVTTKWHFDQDVKVVPGAKFTKRMCDRCASLQKGGDVVATSQFMLRWQVRFTQMGCAQRETHNYMWREQVNKVISSGDLYYCLLPQCEALRGCRSRFLIATQEIYFLVFRMPNTYKWPEMNMYLD